jgi:hypothetical protein
MADPPPELGVPTPAVRRQCVPPYAPRSRDLPVAADQPLVDWMARCATTALDSRAKQMASSSWRRQPRLMARLVEEGPLEDIVGGFRVRSRLPSPRPGDLLGLTQRAATLFTTTRPWRFISFSMCTPRSAPLWATACTQRRRRGARRRSAALRRRPPDPAARLRDGEHHPLLRRVPASFTRASGLITAPSEGR